MLKATTPGIPSINVNVVLNSFKCICVSQQGWTCTFNEEEFIYYVKEAKFTLRKCTSTLSLHSYKPILIREFVFQCANSKNIIIGFIIIVTEIAIFVIFLDSGW